MAKLTKNMATKSIFKINETHTKVARSLAMGLSINDCAKYCFDCRTEDGVYYDDKKVKYHENQIRKWMNNPDFIELYRLVITRLAMPSYGRAVTRISKQIDSENEWLANKAANDTINMFKDVVMGNDDKEVVIKIEGMPELGTPGDEAEEE